MISILFVVLLGVLFMITTSRRTPIAFLRFLVTLLGIFIFLSFWFGLLDVPINLFTWSGVMGVLTIVTGVARWKMGGLAIFDYEKKEKAEGPEEKKISGIAHKLLIYGFAAGIIVGALYFIRDFQQPQFVSIDPSLHYIWAKKIIADEKLQYFSRSIFFPDSTNAHTYPYGAAVISSISISLLDFWDSFASFQLVNVILYALMNAYGLYVLQKLFKIQRKEVVVVAFLLITLSFFLNTMIMGFTSQLAGVFFMFACLDAYISMSWSWKKVVLIGLLMSAVLMTYFHWGVYLALFMGIDQVNRLLAVKWKEYRTELLWVLAAAGVFLLFSGHYFYMIFSSTLLGVITTSDGLAYKVFLGNFFWFIPFLAIFVYPSLKNLISRKPWNDHGFSFLVISLLYTGVLGALFILDTFEAYIFAKSFYLTIPVIFYAAMKGFEIATDGKVVALKIFKWTFLAMVTYLILSPFTGSIRSYTLGDALPVRFDDLNIRPLDIFTYNGQNFVNPAIHSYDVEWTTVAFAKEVPSHIPIELPDNRISVVADGGRCLWFYAFSDLWPRDVPDQLHLWTPQFLDWNSWLSSRQSDYLILLDDGYTFKWTESSGFKWEYFDVVYQEGANYLLHYKGGGERVIVE